MECPQCHRETVEGAVFCNYCGTQLQALCRNCQATSPPESRFCHKCGARIEPQAESEKGTTGPAAEVAKPSGSGALCPRCRTTNEPGSTYCFQCGLPLREVPARAPALTRGTAAQLGTPAGFWVRAAAYIIDDVMIAIVTIIVVAMVMGGSYFETLMGDQPLTFSPLDAMNSALGALYFTVLVSAWGTTLGKRLFGLYVIRRDGSRVSAARALVRYLLYFLSAITLFIGFIMIGLRRDKRGLHDLICDTRVVRRR